MPFDESGIKLTKGLLAYKLLKFAFKKEVTIEVYCTDKKTMIGNVVKYDAHFNIILAHAVEIDETKPNAGLMARHFTGNLLLVGNNVVSVGLARDSDADTDYESDDDNETDDEDDEDE